ncbi:MutS-related protein [Clostridium sp. DL1XJH146]
MFKKKNLLEIRKDWGHEIQRKRKIEKSKKFFNKLIKYYKPEYYVDNQTSKDIDLDNIYKKIDRTYSSAGEDILYYTLRTPKFDENILVNRDKVINEFKINSSLREEIQLALKKLDRTKSNVSTIFFGSLMKSKQLKILANILTLLFTFFLLLSLITFSSQYVMLLIIIGIYNMFFHYSTDKKIESMSDATLYVGSVINASIKISSILEKEDKGRVLNTYTDKLTLLNKKCKKISKKSSLIGRVTGLDVFGDYIFAIFLVKIRGYFSMVDTIEKYKDELLEIYYLVGEIDALQSISSYRENLPLYCKPSFQNENRVFEVTDMVHPLLENPIANSINIDNNGIIITGSNMAGKTTFLKSLAINAIFAQTIYTSLSTSYNASFFNIVTSIDPEDNVLEGKSYYLGEAEAILRIIKACDNKVPCLTVIDEIFTGTNPTERIASSTEVLNYLNRHNSLVAVATHDLELTKLVTGYQNYYFREHVDGNELSFDYLIKKGISPTRNAVRILKMIGYPDEIIDEIEKNISLN